MIATIDAKYFKGCGPTSPKVTGFNDICGSTVYVGDKVVLYVCLNDDSNFDADFKLNVFTAFAGMDGWNDSIE